MYKDHQPYYMFTTYSQLEKSINSLLGIIEGISIDSEINQQELKFLNLWLEEHKNVQQKHPFNELMPVIADALKDGVLDEEERANIKWLCKNLSSKSYINKTTAALQRLHSILAGVVADSQITEKELSGLSDWLMEHEDLRSCWPYDEVDSLITVVLSDQVIDEKEHKLLMAFFSEFIDLYDDKTLTAPLFSNDNSTIQGVCATCPEIVFEESLFCVTGASGSYSRKEFFEVIESLGGKTTKNLTQKVNYLIIGSEGNPCWAYACYGRKVEKAINMRKKGLPLVIVHENDFHDAMLDA
ncbi:NAD-dependent DNA ligase [Kangiella sp. HD9-110m-PIT-SAG06]|nr:NAD-dependent DNA ligase [Kangiella sp. HD9-110m-PIT-SAG06]RDX35573.1 NAD-dependent DNA ligase [Kangiella sp. HD9-110m-PIT-SAG07]